MNPLFIDVDQLHLKLQTEFPYTSVNPNWTDDPEHNAFFIRQIEGYFNAKLQARGHVFLNEVLDDLGIPRTQSGQIMGWAYSQDVTDEVVIRIGFSIENNMFIDLNPHRIILDLLEN